MPNAPRFHMPMHQRPAPEGMPPAPRRPRYGLDALTIPALEREREGAQSALNRADFELEMAASGGAGFGETADADLRKRLASKVGRLERELERIEEELAERRERNLARALRREGGS